MSSAPPPPPPPPPPPAPPTLPVPSKPERGGIVLDSVLPTHYMYVGQMGVYKYRQQHETIQRGHEEGNDTRTIFLSFYRTVIPVIQSGPLCGLVAVAMAAPLVGAQEVTTETLLDTAIHHGYTKQGEMFSATSMHHLVDSVLVAPYSSEVVHHSDEAQVLKSLLQGDLLLIPYDADKNHSPCLKKGHKAHWMLITGCFLAVNNSDKFIDLPLLEENEDYYERNLFHLRPQDKTTPDVLNTLQQHVDKIVSTFVYGHQGKSKHTGVWTISELLASNSQLTELEPNRSVDEYLVPKGGVEQGLCGQIVRIFRLNQI